jgi:hypothetical protein
LAYTVNADGEVVKFVTRCVNKYRPLDYLNEKAAAGDRDVDQLVPRFLKIVRRMIELGFLLPA